MSIFDRLPNNYSSNHYAAKYLQLSLFFALAAPNKSDRDKKSIFNAALHIGQILRNNYKEISSVPDNAVFFKTMDVFVNEMSDVFKISHYYWENLVKRGMVILPFLIQLKSRGYAAIRGGLPPLAVCGLS